MTRLAALGLTSPEEEVYVRLCHVRSASPSELAAPGLPETAVERALEALSAYGLVRPGGSGGRFSAVAPDVALETRLAERQQELRAARAAVDGLMEVYRSWALGRRPGELVEALESEREIALAFETMQRNAVHELVGFMKPPVPDLSHRNPTEREQLAKGITYRGIYERSMLGIPGLYASLLSSTADGEEVRIAPSLPMKMIIADGRMALVTVTGEAGISQSGALLVHASSLVDALAALFEGMWLVSTPVPARGRGDAEGPASPLGEDSRKVVSLLLAGLTDQSVATQLGWSLRKVQGHVRQLMDVTGAGSRVQLGWQLARRGWQ